MFPMKWHNKTILILSSVICCTSLSLLVGDQFFDSVFKTFLGHITGLTKNGILCAVAGASLRTIIGIKLDKVIKSNRVRLAGNSDQFFLFCLTSFLMSGSEVIIFSYGKSKKFLRFAFQSPWICLFFRSVYLRWDDSDLLYQI